MAPPGKILLVLQLLLGLRLPFPRQALRFSCSSGSGQVDPLVGLDVILGHASAVGVPEPEGVLGGCVSLLRGLAHQDFWIFISGLAQGVSGRPELVTMT